MFGAVATIANVNGIAFCILLLPDLLSAAFPTVRNRVADHQQIDRLAFRRFQFLCVPLTPPFVAPVFRRNCFDCLPGVVRLGGDQLRSGEQCEQEEYEWQWVASHGSSLELSRPEIVAAYCGGRLCEVSIVTQDENGVKQSPDRGLP